MSAAAVQGTIDLPLAQRTDHTTLKWIGLPKPRRSRRTPDSCFLITRKIFVLETYHDLTYPKIFFSHLFCFTAVTPRRRTENSSHFLQVAVRNVNFYKTSRYPRRKSAACRPFTPSHPRYEHKGNSSKDSGLATLAAATWAGIGNACFSSDQPEVSSTHLLGHFH